MLHVRNLSKQFSGQSVLHEVSFSLAEGEFMCLLGASGCGKTTLLRTIAGLESVDAGTIELDGIDVTAVQPFNRPVSMMFQSYALFPHMSVADNIGYGLARRGVSKKNRRHPVAEAMELLKLSPLQDRKPTKLSGGQKQRVALARSLVLKPRLLLLDEPLAAMDRKLREITQFELMRIQKETQTAFVVVTHDQREAMTMAERIGFMNHGRIEQMGTPAELYHQPNSLAVASLIGPCNLIEGRLYQRGTAKRFECGGLNIAMHGTQAYGTGRGTLVCRPEHVSLSDVNQPSAQAASVCVTQRIFRGDHWLYTVRLQHTDIRLQVQQPLEQAHYESGEHLWLSWQPERLMFFAADHTPRHDRVPQYHHEHAYG